MGDSSLDAIEFDLKLNTILSNINRARIMHFLDGCENKECQAERMAVELGLSHRTVLYHLDILHDMGCVEVRKLRKKGNKFVRSVWGLNSENGNIPKLLEFIRTKIPEEQLLPQEKRVPRSQKYSF